MEHIVKGAHDKIVQTIEAMIRMSWHQKSPESTPTGLGIEAMFSYGHIWTHMISYDHIWSHMVSRTIADINSLLQCCLY